MWRTAIDRVLYEYFPLVRRLLQRIQIESDQVVEEVPFHLTTEDVDLAAQDVQCVTVSTGWAWSSW